MSVLGQSLNLLSSILTILLTCPNSDTLVCYSNNPFLTVYTNASSLARAWLPPVTHLALMVTGLDFMNSEDPKALQILSGSRTIPQLQVGYQIIDRNLCCGAINVIVKFFFSHEYDGCSLNSSSIEEYSIFWDYYCQQHPIGNIRHSFLQSRCQ